jgi:hypothetical protein
MLFLSFGMFARNFIMQGGKMSEYELELEKLCLQLNEEEGR